MMISFVLALGTLCAAEVTKSAPLSNAEKAVRRAEAQQRLMERHGGIVIFEARGAMGGVNCQSRLSITNLTDKLNELKRLTRMNLNLVDGKFDLADVKIPSPNSIALFVVDDPKLPMSLVSVESKWGMLNVEKLCSDNPSEAKLKSRFAKEFVRIAVMTFGGGVSQYRGSPLQPVFSVEDLDAVINDGMTIDATTALMRNLNKLGIQQTKRATYRRACEEGWAPAPTNKWQRAVFEQVKADKERGPTNPLKIVPPKKP